MLNKLFAIYIKYKNILLTFYLNVIYFLQISRLTAQQLSDMGITLVGHQKKILHQARQLDIII